MIEPCLLGDRVGGGYFHGIFPLTYDQPEFVLI